MSLHRQVATCDLLQGSEGLARQFRALTAEHRVVLGQLCDHCQNAQFPPMLACNRCHTTNLSWADVGGDGVLTSWVTVTGGEATPGYTIPKHLRAHLPYATAFVQPHAVTEDFHIPALLTGPSVLDLEAGMRVRTLITDLTGAPVATLEIESAHVPGREGSR